MADEVDAMMPVVLAAVVSEAMMDVRGARIQEASVRKTIVVGKSAGQARTLRAGFRLAHQQLVKGIPTRLKIAAGTYRESVLDLDWKAGKAATTLLVVEADGAVIWTGSNVFPLSSWKREGELLVHPWLHRFGNFAWSWGPKKLIGHRSEMAFIGSQALRPRILEKYEIAGIEQDPAVQNQVAYRYVGVEDPARILKPGEFGVFEREDNSPRIVVRPQAGAKLTANSIEVSVRRRLLDLTGKSNVVLRGITFQRCANDDRAYGGMNAVTFGGQGGEASEDVLIDRCQFLWNASAGLQIAGNRWTLRDSKFNYNGFSGLATGKSRDILWERTETNFNVWRAWRGGELGYFTGGFKAHELVGHRIEGHTAIGNCTMGAWWDVQCRDVVVRDLVAIGNAANVQFELCNGPLVAERWLVAAGKAGDGQLRFWEHGPTLLKDSILYSNCYASGKTGLYNLRWFGREDGHAKMERLIAGENRSEGNIFVAGPNVPNFGLIDDIRGAAWTAKEPMTYRGSRNVFWKEGDPDFHMRWIKDDDRKGELAARAISVKDWLRAPTYVEASPRFLDPGLRDPVGYDFRFAKTSPLYGERMRYPQVALSAAFLAEWRRFTAWSGYQPDVWNEPTGD